MAGFVGISSFGPGPGRIRFRCGPRTKPRLGPATRGGRSKAPLITSGGCLVGVVSERRTGGRVRGGRMVVLLAYPGADLLDVAGPCAVFHAFEHAPGRPEEDTTPGYRIEVVSTGGGSHVETSCRVELVADR